MFEVLAREKSTLGELFKLDKRLKKVSALDLSVSPKKKTRLNLDAPAIESLELKEGEAVKLETLDWSKFNEGMLKEH